MTVKYARWNGTIDWSTSENPVFVYADAESNKLNLQTETWISEVRDIKLRSTDQVDETRLWSWGGTKEDLNCPIDMYGAIMMNATSCTPM